MIFNLSFIFLCLLTSAGKAAPPTTTLRIATTNIPPVLQHHEGSKPSGSLVEFWEKHVARHANVKIDWVGPLAIYRAELLLKKGEIDILAVSKKTPERDMMGIYSKTPLTQASSAFISLSSEPTNSIHDIKDLQKKVIGISTSVTPGDFIRKHESELDIFRYTSMDPQDQMLAHLLSQRVWAIYVVAPFSFISFAAEKGKAEKIKIIKIPEPDLEYYALYSRHLSPQIRDRLDEAIKKGRSEYNVEKEISRICSAKLKQDCKNLFPNGK